ncbi:MAG: alkaline phosphatase [Clostridia bacterium]|nr:alkaline phosphatase [Clostridia bacterium]
MKSKRLLCLLLTILMLLPLFAACKKDGKPVDIVKDGQSDYVVIYSDDKNAAIEKAAATKLRNAIKDATGVRLEMDTDWSPDDPMQILVGTTKREATQNALTLVRQKDFIITYSEGRVIVTGGSSAATMRAVDYFIANYINKEKAKVTVYDGKDYIERFDYMLGDLSVSGKSLSEYTIVYPSGAENNDKITYYIAVNLYDYILNNAGIALKLASDNTAPTANEILIGKTNRTESRAVANTTLADDEYLLFQSGSKIVMMGNSYMVGGAASALVNKYFVSKGANVPVDITLPTAATPAKFAFEKATSALLLIGDGMGFEHIQAGIGVAGSGLITEFVAERLPYKTSVITASQSVLNGEAEYTDSAAAATALATGYKTTNYYVGKTPDGSNVQNVRELAHSKGAKTGILTTAKIEDATPAAFLAHAMDRNDKSIGTDINALLTSGGVNYAVGDTNDLTKVKEELLIANAREMLSTLSENNHKFFGMIEEAHVDKNSHKVQSGARSLADVQNSVKCYNEVIAYAIGFTMLHPSTALIVTADHECGKLDFNEATGAARFDSDNHSNANVPFFGIGDGIAELIAGKTAIDNTEIAKFIAKIYGDNNFGG